MGKYNDTIREQYRDKFRDYLGQRLSKERPLSGKVVPSINTIKMYAGDTFYLEKHTDIDFMHWYISPEMLESAQTALNEILCKKKGNSTKRKLERDVDAYYTDMCWFRDFLIEEGHMPDYKERGFGKDEWSVKN